MEMLAEIGNSVVHKKNVSSNWHTAYGVGHLIARLSLKRSEHHALASMSADTQAAQIQLSLEISALKAEITEWVMKRPMPDASWADVPPVPQPLVIQLAGLSVDDKHLAAKAVLVVRDYWFGTIIPRLAQDDPLLNASTFRNLCDSLEAEALDMRHHHRNKLTKLYP